MTRRADTTDEARFRAEARAWLEAHGLAWRAEAEAIGFGQKHTPEAERVWFEHCRAWQRTLYDGGWAALTLPTEVGGRGLSVPYRILFEEEAARHQVTAGFVGASLALIVPALLTFGSSEQQARFLAPALRGDEAWCQLFSEPEAGSDLAGLRCSAVVDGDELLVNGQKLWTSSAQFCEWGFLLARTNPEAPKHAGISFLLLDMRSPGVDVRPLPTITGSRHFNEVFFTDVRVPLSQIVGGIDQGWGVTRLVLASESVSIGTSGPNRDSAEDLVRLARERGRLKEPPVRDAVAAAHIEEQILGWLGERIRTAVLDGHAPDVDGSVLKILWAESRARRSDVALEILGADALLDGTDAYRAGFWQNQMLDRYQGLIGGGTVEVHRNGIGERVLGLPRETREDREVPFRDLTKKPSE
ncbi:MAG: acyl-CoA dehydrogenase family protein [Candidatus Binatia bacterium]|nr:acyl-CoA dehydrogenase family protein [Candidatus Binatia bacterium]